MNNLISAFIGALLSIMLMFNSTLCKWYGGYTASIIIHAAGLVTVILILLVSKSRLKLRYGLPIYLYSAGFIGVFTVVFNNMTFATLGASLTLALGLLGQSVSAIIIDHYGLLHMDIVRFDKRKIIGIVFILTGIIVMTIF